MGDGMKRISLLFLCIVVFGRLNGQSPSNDALRKFEKLGWLQYRWILTNGKPGQSGVEQWMKISAVELRGIGATLAGGDTVFVEKLKILVEGNSIYYVADVRENQSPVRFRLTEISDSGFVFENPRHDFPKRIAYQLRDGKLKATISGNGKAIDYLFLRE